MNYADIENEIARDRAAEEVARLENRMADAADAHRRVRANQWLLESLGGEV